MAQQPERLPGERNPQGKGDEAAPGADAEVLPRRSRMTQVSSPAGPQVSTRSSRGLDLPILTSNLVAGGVLLGVLAVISWPLALMGMAYVVVVGVFFAVIYRRPSMRWRWEAAVWAGPWLVAVALYAWLASAIEGGTSSWLWTVWFGLVIATPCYLGWQALSLAVRQMLSRT